MANPLRRGFFFSVMTSVPRYLHRRNRVVVFVSYTKSRPIVRSWVNCNGIVWHVYGLVKSGSANAGGRLFEARLAKPYETLWLLTS